LVIQKDPIWIEESLTLGGIAAEDTRKVRALPRIRTKTAPPDHGSMPRARPRFICFKGRVREGAAVSINS